MFQFQHAHKVFKQTRSIHYLSIKLPLLLQDSPAKPKPEAEADCPIPADKPAPSAPTSTTSDPGADGDLDLLDSEAGIFHTINTSNFNMDYKKKQMNYHVLTIYAIALAQFGDLFKKINCDA